MPLQVTLPKKAARKLKITRRTLLSTRECKEPRLRLPVDYLKFTTIVKTFSILFTDIYKLAGETKF